MNPMPKSASASQALCDARRKVLDDPFLLRAILRETDTQQHRALETVSKSWRLAVSEPAFWFARHEPGMIDAPKRSIYTAYQARSMGRLFEFAGLPPPMKRTLGVFGDGGWTLRTGYRPAPPSNQVVTRMLDEVVRLRGWGIKPVGKDRTWHAAQTQRNRTQALSFLLDRAYRLNHNLSICVYRADALLVLACTGFLAAAQIAQHHGTAASQKVQHGVFGVLQAIEIGVWVLLVGCIYMGGIPLIRNIAFGHRDSLRLNQWALIAACSEEHTNA